MERQASIQCPPHIKSYQLPGRQVGGSEGTLHIVRIAFTTFTPIIPLPAHSHEVSTAVLRHLVGELEILLLCQVARHPLERLLHKLSSSGLVRERDVDAACKSEGDHRG